VSQVAERAEQAEHSSEDQREAAGAEEDENRLPEGDDGVRDDEAKDEESGYPWHLAHPANDRIVVWGGPEGSDGTRAFVGCSRVDCITLFHRLTWLGLHHSVGVRASAEY
jgi:hypothetical protein